VGNLLELPQVKKNKITKSHGTHCSLIVQVKLHRTRSAAQDNIALLCKTRTLAITAQE